MPAGSRARRRRRMTSVPGRRTQAERRTATRSALVRATVDCLVELGYARTTTQEVQSRAGVSRGALTHHFTTKADLVLAAMDHLYEEFSESVREGRRRAARRPGRRIRLGVELVWERFHGPLFVAAMELWTAARTDAELRAALLPHERRLGRSCAGCRSEVFGERLARHPSSEAVYQVLLTSMRGQAMTYALQPDAPRSGPHVQYWIAMVEAFAPPCQPGGPGMTRVADHRHRLRRARRRRPAEGRPASTTSSCSRRADDVGGVWRENTYPGAACDVTSHLYSLSFAPKADWSRRFAPQAEIHQYLRDVARDFGVLPAHPVRHRGARRRLRRGRGTWRLTLAGGSEHEADVLVTATGQLSRPSRPDVPGLDRFGGTVFHSARVGPRPRPHRRAGRRHRHRRQRDPVRAGDRAATARAHGLPALGAVRAAQARPAPYATRAQTALRRVPGPAAAQPRGHLPHQRAALASASTPSRGCCSPTGPGSAGTCARSCPTRSCARSSRPTTRWAASGS